MIFPPASVIRVTHEIPVFANVIEYFQKLYRIRHYVLKKTYATSETKNTNDRLIRDFKRINSKVHIVAMTGYNSRELEREVRRQGVSYYMIKPFEIDQLKSILDHMNTKVM